MSQHKSRMERNAKLHQELMSERNDKIETKELSVFANHLNEIDSQFERMDVPKETSSDYQSPLHIRNSHYALKKEVLTPEIEVQSTDEEASFSNDYLEAFIDEVKQYNVDKGYRSKLDTKSNVLSGIDGWQTNVRPFGNNPEYYTGQSKKRSQPIVEPSEPEEPVLKQVAPIEPLPVDEQQTIMMEVQRLSEMSMPTADEIVDEENETILLDTQKIKESESVRMIEPTPVVKELVDTEKKVVTTSERIINFLLYLLVFASFVVVIVIIYILLKVNNII